ncbi:hypothetical protein N9L75_03640 [Porticoccaceae bacterium]|nr:hypothetical protein [Porticoccaceae bacterium]MDA8651648.1 hypothetical protein [Porticoccaceae bacterium]MDA8682408.1 hypothetical protein [Porticoccaceae bacterium]MDB2664453.1 hypothetical protein [Porticoccaceae bacterium]
MRNKRLPLKGGFEHDQSSQWRYFCSKKAIKAESTYKCRVRKDGIKQCRLPSGGR